MTHLRSLAVAVACLAGATAAQAQHQPPDQETLKRNLDKKLAGAWLKKAPWILDFDEARETSRKTGKLIFAYFTRSYEP